MRVTTKIVFDEVRVKRRRTYTCRVCGMRGSAQRTFSQFVSPFNRNAAGKTKTYREIQEQLRIQADAWRPEPYHVRCRAQIPSSGLL